jgi:Carboxypeptidase regulatory-like domain
MKALNSVLCAAAILSSLVGRAFCAEIVGVITDSQGQGIANVRIIAMNMSNNASSETHSKANGRYQITGLPPGVYKYTVDPGASGFKGGDAVSYLGGKGLTIDWQLSATNGAIALASDGAGTMLANDPYGFTEQEYATIVMGSAALVTGGVVGGLAASGQFSGSSSGPPASPSL